MLLVVCMKLLSLITKSLASGNMDMVVARTMDDENRRLLNSCQCLNTGHKLSYHGELFPCLIFLFQAILPFNLPPRQVHYLKSENAAGYEQILSNQKGFNDCGMRVLCEGRSRALHSIDENIALIHPGCHMKTLLGKTELKIEFHTCCIVEDVKGRVESKLRLDRMLQPGDRWAHITNK